MDLGIDYLFRSVYFCLFCRTKSDDALLQAIRAHDSPLAVVLHNIDGPSGQPPRPAPCLTHHSMRICNLHGQFELTAVLAFLALKAVVLLAIHSSRIYRLLGQVASGDLYVLARLFQG